MQSLVNEDVKIRVSSVLNKDGKQFGKQHMFDNIEETCWNSDQGSPQWIHLEFSHCIFLDEIQIQFQGGFAGKHCYLETVSEETGSPQKIEDFYPEDTNKLQISFLPDQILHSF